VDDYWIDFEDPGPDPWIVNGWTEHTHGDCTGDFMGTNQSSFGNIDGATTFYYYTNGDPLYDFTGCEPDNRDGCHGLKLFVESRGYSVKTNFSQYIKGQGSDPNKGFTFSDFMAEIDAGRPVLIQLVGRTVLGYGYDTEGNVVYIHDTQDHSSHQMTWGGSYDSFMHKGVTVIQLASTVPLIVTTNNASSITDSSATLNGYLDDMGTASTVYVSFEHGLTTAYGYRTPPQEMTSAGPFSYDLGGLCPNTTYHVRAKAVGDETSYGLDKSFTTSDVGAVEVSIDAPAEVAPNSDFTADVVISQVDNFDAASYNVSFNDSILRLDNVTSGQLDTTVIPVDSWNEISPGTYTIIQNVPGLVGVSGSGTLAILHFHVVGTECQTSPIDLSDGILGDNLAQQIPATWIGDSVHVSTSGVLPGDANGDGVVNNLDITKVERIIVGLDAETPGADANQDGVVNNLDITKVERIIVGLD
jgi:YD repeat-containing protein